VLELEGAIFFGTVERLADAIERAVADGARFLILDLGRVTDVDKGLYRDLPLCGLRSPSRTHSCTHRNRSPHRSAS